MESVFGRYRNLVVLVFVLFAQILGLAVQVKRTRDAEPTRLIRIWAVGSVSPLEKGLSWVQNSTGNLWSNYVYLRGVRAENRELKRQIEQMRFDQSRMAQDAEQARRLQALLGFKEQFIAQTMAAQVIGGTGSELSRSIYIDKGERDGIKPDMAVVTKDGIVGKVLRVYRSSSLVLLIDDQTSGVGSILEKSRLQGILRGTSSGEVVLEKVMSDETVPEGEQVLTSGGDGIFPKGLPVGTVTKVKPGNDLFLSIRVRPSADLNRLEEVLVVTKVDEKQPDVDQTAPIRAVDILAQRLPTVPPKPEPASPGTTGVTGPAAGAKKSGTLAANGTAPGTQPSAALTKPSANAAVGPGTSSTTSLPRSETVTSAQSAARAAAATGGVKSNSVGANGAPSTQNTNSPPTIAKKNSNPTPSSPAGTASAAPIPAKRTVPSTAPALTGTNPTGTNASGAKSSVTKPATTMTPATGAAKKPGPKPANRDAATAPPKPQPQDTPQ